MQLIKTSENQSSERMLQNIFYMHQPELDENDERKEKWERLAFQAEVNLISGEPTCHPAI